MDVECICGTAATIVDNTVDPIGVRPSYETFWSKCDFLNDTRRMITVGYSPCGDDQPVESAYQIYPDILTTSCGTVQETVWRILVELESGCFVWYVTLIKLTMKIACQYSVSVIY